MGKKTVKYSNIREILKVDDRKTVIDNGVACFTHFIQNQENGVKKSYEAAALKYLADRDLIDDLPFQKGKLDVKYDIPFPPPAKSKFKFIDLFAGIGGFRLAMQNLGGKCVYTSEWDKYSKKTYEANFGEIPFGDITSPETKSFIPDGFDVLCAGFPCQAFSIAGRRGGFEDTRGTLFFDVAEIIKNKQPKAFFLENVKGLRNHDKGKTLATILHTLREDLGYYVPKPEVLNAKHFGVPQNRERIFIVGFRKDLGIDSFQYPRPTNENVVLEDIIEETEVSVKYYISTTYLNTLKRHRARHEAKGNGFGYEILDMDGVANAVVCGGMGRERNLVLDPRLTTRIPITNIKGEVNREFVRKTTPREWARLQGFPDEFKIIVSDVQAYKQFGNSVAVPAIQATAEELLKKMFKVRSQSHTPSTKNGQPSTKPC